MAIDPGSVVAMLDSATITDHACYLAPVELVEAGAIENQRRRNEWVAGRVAAKYVFLRRARSGDAPASRLSLQPLTPSEVASFSLSEYRAVRVAKHEAAGGGPARADWLMEPDGRRGSTESVSAVSVAISHSQGVACAFIGSGNTYSLDIERPAPRSASFYLQNFTSSERSWATACAEIFSLNPEWLYAFLWSAKECLLKTPLFSGLSLWNMSDLEVRIVGGSEHLSRLSDHFAFVTALIGCPSSSQGLVSNKQLQLAVSGAAGFVVTAIPSLN